MNNDKTFDPLTQASTADIPEPANDDAPLELCLLRTHGGYFAMRRLNAI